MKEKKKRPPGGTHTGTDTEACFLDVNYTTSRTETQAEISAAVESGATV